MPVLTVHNVCDSTTSSITIGSTYASYNWNTGATTPSVNHLVSMTYIVTVSSTNGCTGSASHTVVNGCNIPIGLNSTNVARFSANANWIQAPCYYGYTVRISKHNMNVWNNYVITPNAHYTFSGLTPNTAYDWEIQTNCNASGTVNSGFSPSQTFTTLARLEDGVVANNNSFNVYPNPASDQATIVFSSDKEEAYSIRLIDITGRIVIDEKQTSVIGENQYQMNLSELAKGIYMVILQNNDGTLQKKIVVQ
jgi:hypothetical protein